MITGIDENGVRFRSSMTASTFVPHDKVQAVELAPEGAITVKLPRPKRERLLTLPRMQKASPPTHLIRPRNGDYLRGRVTMLDDSRLRVETRLEEKDLPRDRIARIIWLHPEELDPKKKPPTEGQPTRVQAVRNDGIRVTFIPDLFAGDVLSGKSDVLGATRVRVGEIDQLLIGAGIEEAAAHLTYGQWKLQNAPEPIEPVNDSPGGGGGRRGGERVAPGRQAGPRLRPRARGRQAVPPGRQQGEGRRARLLGHLVRPVHPGHAPGREGRRRIRREGRAARRRQPPGDAQQIEAMMKRHQFKIPRVALDKDGSIAEKYQAHAIPQTVVIGRDGTIAPVRRRRAPPRRPAPRRHQGDPGGREARGEDRQVAEDRTGRGREPE